MFWHEAEENDVNLIPYTKSDYLKMMTKKIGKSKEIKSLEEVMKDSKEKNVLDLSQPFKVNMIVSSDWGPGKVVSVNNNTHKVVLKIEGVDKEFDMFGLHPFMQVNIHVIYKNLNKIDKRVTISIDIFMDDTIGKIKKRIANIFRTNESKVFLIHNFEKLENNNQKVSDCSFFDQDNVLAIINGTCDY